MTFYLVLFELNLRQMGSNGSSLPDSPEDLQRRLESVIWNTSDDENDTEATARSIEEQDALNAASTESTGITNRSTQSNVIESIDSPPEASARILTSRDTSVESNSSSRVNRPVQLTTTVLSTCRLNSSIVRRLEILSTPGDDQLLSPQGFCLGLDGSIVIADTNHNRICMYDALGKLESTFGSSGTDKGQLWYPTKIAFIPGPIGEHGSTKTSRYVICDRYGRRSRMQIFTCSGEFILEIVIEGIYAIEGLAITSEDHIVAVNSSPPSVIILNQSGQVVRWFDCSFYVKEPSDLAIASDKLYICDFQGHCVVIFSLSGEFIRKISNQHLTCFPTGVHVSKVGDIYISDFHDDKFRVAIFDGLDNLLGKFESVKYEVYHSSGLQLNSNGDLVTLDWKGDRAIVLNSPYICDFVSLRSFR